MGCDTFRLLQQQQLCCLSYPRGIQPSFSRNVSTPATSCKVSAYHSSQIYSPLLWASSCDKELTATLHSEQYSSFLALSSSVSGLDGLLEAGVPTAPETGGPDPGCSELELPLPQPGEEEEGGIRGGVVVGRRGHTEGTGESMGGVGGVVRGGRGPGASRAPFNCDRGRGSSRKTKRSRERRNKCQKQCRGI